MINNNVIVKRCGCSEDAGKASVRFASRSGDCKEKINGYRGSLDAEPGGVSHGGGRGCKEGGYDRRGDLGSITKHSPMGTPDIASV